MSKIACTQGNGQILRRSGPSTGDYLGDLVQFLYCRTGFNLDNLRAPGHLKHLLEQLSFNRVPLAVWQGLLNCALKIANRSKTIDHGLRHFGALFVDALCWVFNRLTKMGVLKIAIFLLAAEICPLTTLVVSFIYYVIEWLLDHFWEQFSKFVQSHLITAPYYALCTRM